METEYRYKGKYNPRSNRLAHYDYSNSGAYFITICTRNREKYFGEIVDGEIRLNIFGEIIYRKYLSIQDRFNFVKTSTCVIMPDHLHFVLFLEKKGEEIIDNKENELGDAINRRLYDDIARGGITGPINSMLNDGLGKVINWFKGICTYEVNKVDKNICFSWQKNYYDRIIRNDKELYKIKNYIKNNPKKWEMGKNNEKGIFM